MYWVNLRFFFCSISLTVPVLPRERWLICCARGAIKEVGCSDMEGSIEGDITVPWKKGAESLFCFSKKGISNICVRLSRLHNVKHFNDLFWDGNLGLHILWPHKMLNKDDVRKLSLCICLSPETLSEADISSRIQMFTANHTFLDKWRGCSYRVLHNVGLVRQPGRVLHLEHHSYNICY